MTEPTHLTREQLDPLVAAIYRRQAAADAGASLTLPPLPPCPACKQTPTQLLTRDDQPITDRTLIMFKPCGHLFAANNEDVYEAALSPRLHAECPLPDIDHRS
ncbi:hypothetical protein [Streptomyces sp. NRRL S-813]|uniref:hypothetical protein n=1 Tax=Streptomyces sp. NRRL S-813 TaxID=1463919 RepID=UPI0004BFFE39|nr:hypothetical protein [Streptomyces sp. NRRL S-813]